MIGLASAVQKSISQRDSLSLEIWAKLEAKRIAANSEKRQAAKRRRLANTDAPPPKD